MALKKIFIILVLGGVFISLPSFVLNSGHGSNGIAEESSDMPEDSLVNVIAWFENRDTMTYWIYDGKWDIVGEDTVNTMGAYTKIMITVTDSTKRGYNMECKFLDLEMDTSINTGKQRLMKLSADKLRESIAGTTIKFRTDETGRIIKYGNIEEIKNRARTTLKEIIGSIPYIDTLIAAGIKIEPLMKMIDASVLVDGYVEELELLFQWHGSQFKTGEYTMHDDATDKEYEADTYMEVWQNPESYEYEIVVDINNYIPKEDLKDVLAVLADVFFDKEVVGQVKDEVDFEMEELVKADVVGTRTFLYHSYFPDGWPEKVISRKILNIGNKGKITQKYITCDYRSISNY